MPETQGLEGGSWSRIPALFHHYPEAINARCRLALSIDILHSPGWFGFAARTFIWVVTISRLPDRQAKKSRIPCANFGESRFPGSSQIPNPVKIFCVFPIPASFLSNPGSREYPSRPWKQIYKNTLWLRVFCNQILALKYGKFWLWAIT